jgi:hypothetical protein
MTLSFKDYAKKLEALGENVPKVFKSVAKRGAVHAENTAKRLTDQEKLVDTGAYRRNWNAEGVELEKDVYAITLQNSMDYASHLEQGHRLRNGKRWQGRFVGARTLSDTEGEVILTLQEEIDIAMTQQKFGLSRAEAKKYLK